jgi:AsmA protein
MPKFLKYFVFSFVALVIILLIAPLLIPTDSYKGLLINEVKKATKRDLVIDGTIKLSFLPKPSISLTKLKLPSVPKAQDPIMVEADEVSGSLSLVSLLTGNIVISSIELIKPVVKLETLNDGTSTWEFTKIADNKQVADNQAKTIESNKASGSIKELPFYVEKISIKNGQLLYRKGSDKTIIENIYLELGIDSARGPINFATQFDAFNQNINISGKVKDLGDIIPVIIDVKAGLNKVTIAGNANISELSFAGNIESRGLLKDISSLFADTKITKNPSQAYKVIAPISVSKDKIEVSDADLAMGKLEGKGSATYSLIYKKGNANLIFNPGNLVITIDSSSASDNSLMSQINIAAESIKPILAALGITANVPESLNRKLTFSANNYYKAKEIVLDDIAFVLGEANLKGMLKFTELTAEPNIYYDLKSGNGSALISIFKDNIPINLPEVKIKGSASIDKNNINTKSTVISTLGADIIIKGNIETASAIKPSISLLVYGDNLKQTISRLFDKASIPSMQAFSLSSTIEGDLSRSLNIKLNKSNIVLNSNNTIFSGDTILTVNKQKPFISANIQLSSINLTSASNANIEPSATNKRVSGPSNKSYWSDDKIDMAFLEIIDGSVNLAIDKLTKDSLAFDNIKTRVKLNNGVMQIDSLTGGLYGGKLQALGQVSNKEASFKFDLKEARLNNIITQNNKIKITQGVVNCNSDIKTYGTSLHQYMSNLSGTVNLNGYDGRISGFSLKKIVDNLHKPKNLEDVLRVFKVSFSGGETEFKNFDTVLTIKNGIGDLSSCKLNAEGADLTAKGQINFPKYTMDVKASVAIDINGMPPFNIFLYGFIENPQHKFDIKALQKHLVQNVLNNALEGISKGSVKPKDILNNVIGLGNKKKAGEQETEHHEDKDRQRDQDELKNLMKKGIKGLFK